MRILHTSDWHIGKSLYNFSLLECQREALDFMLDLIVREEIGAVVIAGDIYDRPVPSAEAVRLYDYFLTRAVTELRVPVVAIAGNHDSASRLEFGSRLYQNSGYYVFGLSSEEQPPVILRDEFGELRLHPLPWIHPAQARAMFEAEIKTFDDAYRVLLERRAEKIDSDVRNIALAHGFFAGLKSDAAKKEIITSDSEINIGGMDVADSVYFSAFDYTALGHLHAPQKAGGENIRYSGSPLKYSLSEENQKKSCVIVELGAKNDVQTQLVPIPASHDVRSITGCFDELMEPSFHENRQFDDFVFANITDSGVLYPMEKLRTLFPNLLGLRFITQDESFASPELGSVATSQPSVLEMFQRFYKDAKSVDMPDDRLEFVREILEEIEAGDE